jgi:predicted transcriptional regulator
MTDTVALSFRITKDKARKVEALAKATERQKSWLLEQALDAYLEAQAWQVARVERGLRELEAGKSVAHDRVAKWLAGWGGRREGRAPR